MAKAKNRAVVSRPVKKQAPNDEWARAVYSLAAMLALLAAGATFWKGREVYRHLYLHQTATSTSDFVIILTSIAVIQLAYWSVLLGPPPFVIRKNPVIAHIVLFLSRISFMLAGALFSIVVFVRLEELHLHPRSLLSFVAVLFTIYCFSRWIERIGNAFAKGNRTDEP